MREKICKTIVGRVSVICSDQRAFIYIRKMHKQHDNDGIGGGNLSMALTLFAVLNFLSKIQYFIDKNGKVNFKKNGEPEINEEDAFKNLIKMTRTKKGFSFGLENVDDSELGRIWKTIRNKLTHVCTTTQTMETFLINEPDDRLSVQQILDEAYNKDAFIYENDQNIWRVNVDVLLARMPSIALLVKKNINNKAHESDYYKELMKLIG